MVRILHVSDLHYVPRDYDQGIVLSAFLNDIRVQSTNCPIDAIIFSGDLVKRGSNELDFEEAKRAFIDPMLGACQIDLSRLFLVPGNHDISKKFVDSNVYLDRGLLSELSSLDKINKFVEDAAAREPSALTAFERLENFYNFERSIRANTALLDYPNLKTFKIHINDHILGFACFDSAWRCTGAPNDSDKGKLLIGERSVDHAIDSLRECDLTFGIFHHPVEYLSVIEATAVESRLLVGFDFLCFGHVHSTNPSIKQSSSGRAILSQSGCLYTNREYHNGYQIFEIDTKSRSGTIKARSYFNQPREFRPAINVLDSNGELSFTLSKSSSTNSNIGQFLIAIRSTVRERANRQVTIDLDPDSMPDDIERVFVCPPMRFGKRSTEVAMAAVGGSLDVDVDAILSSEENFILFGSRECGKTSLAHYLALKFAEGFGDVKRLPLIIDARALRGGSSYNILRSASSYLATSGISQTDLSKALENFDAIVLLDNFDPENTRNLEILDSIVNRPKTRVICMATKGHLNEIETAGRRGPLEKCKEVHLEPLPRSAIRKLSSNRYTSNRNSADIFSSVMTNLVSAQLPWNGYIVSLLLWAHSHNKEFSNLNEAVLIETIVNFLLEKGDFSGAFRKTFDSKSKEIVLQSLAVFVTDHGDTIAEKELYEFVFNFFDRRGLDFSAADTISKLLDVGILSRDDGLISFRFRCFQEYFFACAMKEDSDLREKVGNLSSIELYAREIDLFTGNVRRNLGFLDRTMKWVEAVRKKDSRLEKDHDLERASFSGSGHVGFSPARRRAVKKIQLTNEQLDEALEKAEKFALERREEQRKKIAQKRPNTNDGIEHAPSHLLLAVETLGRVVRNSEFDDIDDKMKGLERYIDVCQEVVMTIFSMFEEAIGIILDKKIDFPFELTNDDLHNLMNLVKIASVIHFTKRISEQAGSEKLIPIIERQLKIVSVPFGKAFFLTSLLFDLRSEGSIDLMMNLARNNTNAYRRHIIHEKLCVNYDQRRYNEAEQTKLENAIADIEVMLGTHKSQKGRIINKRRHKTDSND